MLRDLSTAVLTSREFEISVDYRFVIAGEELSSVHVTIAGAANQSARNYELNNFDIPDLDERRIEAIEGETASDDDDFLSLHSSNE